MCVLWPKKEKKIETKDAVERDGKGSRENFAEPFNNNVNIKKTLNSALRRTSLERGSFFPRTFEQQLTHAARKGKEGNSFRATTFLFPVLSYHFVTLATTDIFLAMSSSSH